MVLLCTQLAFRKHFLSEHLLECTWRPKLATNFYCYLSHVLIHLGLYNKISLTGHLISNSKLFFTFMKAEKSKIRALADTMSGEGLLSDSHMTTFWCILTWWMREMSGLRSIWKGTNTIHEESVIMSYSSSQRPYLLILSAWELGFQQKNYRKT